MLVEQQLVLLVQLVAQAHLQVLLVGPQRLEAGWWDPGPSALRDYYVARSSHSGRVEKAVGTPDWPATGSRLRSNTELPGM